MATSKPLWLRGVQAVDQIAGPLLESTVNHDGFILGLSLLQQTRRAVYRRTERASRRVLHGLNLPTASDVNRLLIQIAAVESRVRQLNTQLEGQPSRPRHAPTAAPIENAGAAPAGSGTSARTSASKATARPTAENGAERPPTKRTTVGRSAHKVSARPSRSSGSTA